MMIRYFIDYRFDESKGEFTPIGIWMHNPVDGDVDIYYPDESCPEYDEALWVINRLVEGGLNTPPEFLEYHQTRAGYNGMRGVVYDVATELGYDAIAKQVLEIESKRLKDGSTN